MFESNEPIRPYPFTGWVGWSFNVSALVVVVVVVVVMVVERGLRWLLWWWLTEGFNTSGCGISGGRDGCSGSDGGGVRVEGGSTITSLSLGSHCQIYIKFI